jgi:hypothetical protein
VLLPGLQQRVKAHREAEVQRENSIGLARNDAPLALAVHVEVAAAAAAGP